MDDDRLSRMMSWSITNTTVKQNGSLKRKAKIFRVVTKKKKILTMIRLTPKMYDCIIHCLLSLTTNMAYIQAGWLVPEGYLSEGEGVDSDEDESRRVISRPAVRPAKEVGPIIRERAAVSLND